MVCGKLGGEHFTYDTAKARSWTVAIHPSCDANIRGQRGGRTTKLGPQPKVNVRRNADGGLEMVRR
jgi:hypothetical protein